MNKPALWEKLKKYSVSGIIRVGCVISLFVILVILTVQGRGRWYIALALSVGLLAAFCCPTPPDPAWELLYGEDAAQLLL